MFSSFYKPKSFLFLPSIKVTRTSNNREPDLVQPCGSLWRLFSHRLILHTMEPEQEQQKIGSATHPADNIQKFFIRPFFLTLTIGLPFCIFKGLFGIAAICAGTPSNHILAGFGWLVVIWAVTDFVMNTVRAGGAPYAYSYSVGILHAC